MNPALPNTDPARYHRDGYCLFPSRLPTPDVQAARAALDALIAAMPKKQKVFKDGIEQEVDARPEYLVEPHAQHDFWLELCRHPRVLDAVESVLGPNLILIMSHLIVKRAEDGLPVAWHQDNTYWPSVHGTDVGTVWMAIDDTDRANGCMRVIPCTHSAYEEMEKVKTDGKDLLGLTVKVTPELEAQAIYLEMSAGSFSVHDSYILHGSEANTSGRRRAAYTMRYANALTTRVDVVSHWVPVFLVRGEGGPHGADYIDLRPGVPLGAARGHQRSRPQPA